jgi:BMFP domain-containing protein YqiC
MEINPRVVFERLFGEPGTPAEQRVQRQRDRSILDVINAEAGDLARQVGARDAARLEQYMDNVRELERRIQRLEQHDATAVAVPDAPVGIPEAFEDHVGLMFDLAAAAYEADLTRVVTFMMARELSQRTYPQIGVPEQHHAVSHHGNDPGTIAKVAKINAYHAVLFASFLERLASTPDGDGSLLDHALIFFGGGMGNPNNHAVGPLPMVAAGGGVARRNRHLELPPETPIGNLWLTVAQHYDEPAERFGESTGTIDFF